MKTLTVSAAGTEMQTAAKMELVMMIRFILLDGLEEW